MTKILITGGNGFIGSHLVDKLERETDWEIVSLQRSRRGFRLGRARQVYHDLLAPLTDSIMDELATTDYVVHAARLVSAGLSIESPVSFVKSNVLGTFNLLEGLRKVNVKKLAFMSTVEVLGPAPRLLLLPEDTPLRPSSPYAASKAAAEALVQSYFLSFQVPGIIVRACSLFGPGQRERQFIPSIVRSAKTREMVNCHVSLNNVPGSRQWLDVGEFCGVLKELLEGDLVGETFHVVGPEIDNFVLIKSIGTALGTDIAVRQKVAGPSHDLRYAASDSQIGRQLGQDWQEQLAKTVATYA